MLDICALTKKDTKSTTINISSLVKFAEPFLNEVIGIIKKNNSDYYSLEWKIDSAFCVIRNFKIYNLNSKDIGYYEYLLKDTLLSEYF